MKLRKKRDKGEYRCAACHRPFKRTVYVDRKQRPSSPCCKTSFIRMRRNR